MKREKNIYFQQQKKLKSSADILEKRIKGYDNFIDLHHAKIKEDFPKIQLKFINDLSEFLLGVII